MTALAFALPTPINTRDSKKEESNTFAVKMAGLVRATHKRRKSRAQRMRSRRR